MKSAAALPISERGAFMARPMKNGLDYFPFDVDFFSDRKIKRLRAAYGADGVNVYIYLLCEIYRNGYYTVYDDDLVLDVSDELSIKSNLTTQILNYLFSRSLLQVIEGRLAEPVKVITAASVQRRYQAAKKGAKRDIDVAARFWVLSEEDTEDFIRLRPEGGSSGEKTGNSRKNPDSSREEPTKESKEKQSKENESKAEHTSSAQRDNSAEMEKLRYDYGEDIVSRYVTKVTDWYAGKGRVPEDLCATVREWLEKDGVALYDHSFDKYSFVMNKFDL